MTNLPVALRESEHAVQSKPYRYHLKASFMARQIKPDLGRQWDEELLSMCFNGRINLIIRFNLPAGIYPWTYQR